MIGVDYSLDYCLVYLGYYISLIVLWGSEFIVLISHFNDKAGLHRVVDVFHLAHVQAIFFFFFIFKAIIAKQNIINSLLYVFFKSSV